MRVLILLLALAGGIATAHAQSAPQPQPDPAYAAFARMLAEGQQREFLALRRAEIAERALEAAKTPPLPGSDTSK